MKYHVPRLGPEIEMQDLQATITYGVLIAKYDTTTIETLPFTMLDLQLGKAYGGAFSNYMKTSITIERGGLTWQTITV